jgi:hypothetical protein
LSDAQNALCQGELVDACGGVWHMNPPTFAIQGQYEMWLKLTAKNELKARKPYMGPMAYAEENTALDAAFIALDYSWMGPVFARVIGSDAGSSHLVLLMLKPNHPEANPKLVEELKKDAPENLAWAFTSCLAQADPSHFSPPVVDRPRGVRPASDLNVIPATAATPTPSLPASPPPSSSPS